MYKKLLILFLALSFCLPLNGCAKKEPVEEFDAFIKQVEVTMLEGTTSFNMNFLMNDPEALGFDAPTTYGLGYMSQEESKEMYAELKTIQKQLERYDYDNLNTVQKRTYDALDDYLSRELALEDFYYYNNPVIGSYSSILQDLPMLLQMYAFNDLQDIENFYQDIKQFKSDFLKYAQFEKERQDLGLGLSQEILEDTITQLEAIIASQGTEILIELNQIFANLNFLTDEQIAFYQQKNQEAISDHLMGAYQALADELKKIQGQPETRGLSEMKNGKEYYEAMIYNQLGIKDDIDEIEKKLNEDFKTQTTALQTFVFSHPELLAIEDLYNIHYSSFSTPKEGLDYLKTQIFSMVPQIPDLDYRIYSVPESLEDGFAPAAYLSARLDLRENQTECIMINPNATQNLFPTLVHEGYPGHMYQNSYFNSLHYPTINHLIDCIGYTEGWAVYVENQAASLLTNEDEAAWQKILIYDNQISSSLLALMDIGIHYHGWDLKKCVSFFNSKTGAMLTNDDLQQIYDIIIQRPAYYLYYIYSGQILTDLAIEAKETLGSKFDEVTFNQAILDSGPVGLDIVRKNVSKYIQERK